VREKERERERESEAMRERKKNPLQMGPKRGKGRE